MLSLLLRETKVSFNFIQNPEANFITVYIFEPIELGIYKKQKEQS